MENTPSTAQPQLDCVCRIGHPISDRILQVFGEALRMIKGLGKFSHEERLTEFGIVTLETRAIRWDTIKVSKIRNFCSCMCSSLKEHMQLKRWEKNWVKGTVSVTQCLKSCRTYCHRQPLRSRAEDAKRD